MHPLREALRRGRLCLLVASLGVAAGAGAQQGGMPAAGAADQPAAAAALPEAAQASAQQTPAEPATGSIHGVVVDRGGAVYEGAHVVLSSTAEAAGGAGPGAAAQTSTTTDSNGRFSFAGVAAGTFKLTVGSGGFATQGLTGTLQPGESYQCKPIVLPVSSAFSEVRVTASRVEIAEEQLKQEETQRVLGVVPNFYVSYVPNAPPLTTKQKFELAWKSTIDPMNFVAVGAFAGIDQAANSFSGYGQGAQGYGKRYGAVYADGAIGNFIGGAILSSWWKQDPRYFYKGTGTPRSRVLYAIANAVVCKGDNGRWQMNYSAIVGGLAAGGISNLYYPAGSRTGVSLTFENAAVGMGFSAVQNLLQEFVVRRLTPRVPNYGTGKP